MVSVSKSTKVLRFATPRRLFASCHFETPAHPQATTATFRWAKRVSTVSTHFPHFEPVISHMLSQRFLTCSTYSAVSKLQKLALQRQCDPHHLKLGKAQSMLRCACKDKRKMHRYVRSLRPPPGPSQQRRPCPTPCDQLRILTCDGQATNDHAYTHKHMSY